MPLKSNFKSDLEKEQKLAVLLDAYYKKHLLFYNFERIYDLKKQHEGIDVVFTHKRSKNKYLIDEKAQLDYVNEKLPTFAFELSYLRNGTPKNGWLFNTTKKTDFYALITSIYSDEPGMYTSCKITLVSRKKLLLLLEEKNMNEVSLHSFCAEHINTHGKINYPKLHHKKEGYIFISKNNKAEKPINLILRLNFLVSNGIAKQLI